MKKIIVGLPVSYSNAKTLGEELRNKIYADMQNVNVALPLLLKSDDDDDEDDKEDFVVYHNTDDFINALNDQWINVENYFFTILQLEA